MNLIDFLDRMGDRRIERMRIAPPRPTDTKLLTAALLFVGYYVLIFTMLKVIIPPANAPLVRDALLVLGPVIGAVGQSIFRTDIKDEMASANTGSAFRAMGEQAKATAAAAASTPPFTGAADAADEVAGAAAVRADQIRSEVQP